LDLRKLESVSHAGETLLGALRAEELEVNDRIINLLLSLCDAIRTIVQTIEETKAEGSQSYDALAAELLAAAKPNSSSSNTNSQMSLDDEFEALLDQRAAMIASPQTSNIEKQPELMIEPSVKPASQTEAVESLDPTSGKGAQETSLRVDVNLLNHLMNLAGELVLARNQILQCTKSVDDMNFRAITQRLNLVTTELQEGVMKTRMQPINTVWSKFPRVVRDLSHSCKKQVRLELHGKETELDKTLIEAIKDPLTHIVRNSIDHGIEVPEKRVAAGKSPEGCITMGAFQEGGYVVIEIVDDGAGLNTDKIRDRAVERGLITKERAQAMSEAEIHRLIFAPGFSTADTITNLSGRGVGMDVVKSSVEKIGGSVDITSWSGEGSTIRLKIPLTLAIIPALLFSCGEQRFAIPQNAVIELVQFSATERSGALSWIGSYPFYKLRGDLLPLVFLRDQLGIEAASGENSEQVIMVLDADGRRFGVVVDGVHDTEEIVVKPLGGLLADLQVYAGATILGDGQIALILDPVVLARESTIEQQEQVATQAADSSENLATENREQLLIVQVAADMRVGIPLASVRRLEKFRPEDVETVGGSAMIQYRDSILPLVNVGSFLGVANRCDQSGDVVVVGHDNGTIGVQVEAILDVSSELSAMRPARDKAGISAFGVIQGKVIALVDLEQLIHASADVGGVARASSLDFPGDRIA
jgi:two-component system chemotaxis sensor kinase CheA